MTNLSRTQAAEETASATITDPPSTETAATETDDGDLNTAKPTETETATDTEEETGTKTGGAKKTSTKTKSIPADAAVGGVSITTPVTSAVETVLFKIGDNITMGWNYTGIEVTPTAIDVYLSCASASETWTLTSNMTFETDVLWVWNSEEQAEAVESPLLTEMYTLIIKDSEAEVSENPSPGYLGANSDFTFGLYHGIAYTPWAEWDCAGCSGAVALFDVQAVRLAFTMSIITFATFTYLVTGWGLH